MSMFNPDFEGPGTAGGEHNVGPPTRGTTRDTPGVAKPFTGTYYMELAWFLPSISSTCPLVHINRIRRPWGEPRDG